MPTSRRKRLARRISRRPRRNSPGGVRTPERAAKLISQGARKVIVGTAAFQKRRHQPPTPRIHRRQDRQRANPHRPRIQHTPAVKGWRESTQLTAETVIKDLEPYCGGFLCTYVDKEGMMQGTDLDWFRRLRAATSHEITAAGGITTYDDVRELQDLNIHAALGMAIYTGRLDLSVLAGMNR
ncbi:MAG: HisA/HisF-related TIM barrel protein [Bryobacteraceae bacterium]